MNPTLWAELGAGEALTRLAIARGGLIDDTTAETYLDCLADLYPPRVVQACQQLALEPRGEFESVLPPVAVIRARVSKIEREERAIEAAAKLLPAPKEDDDSPRYSCLDCRDEPNGWREFWCPGQGLGMKLDQPAHLQSPRARCARKQDHPAHTYVERCHCLPTNPSIHKARERMHAYQDRQAKRS